MQAAQLHNVLQSVIDAVSSTPEQLSPAQCLEQAFADMNKQIGADIGNSGKTSDAAPLQTLIEYVHESRWNLCCGGLAGLVPCPVRCWAGAWRLLRAALFSTFIGAEVRTKMTNRTSVALPLIVIVCCAGCRPAVRPVLMMFGGWMAETSATACALHVANVGDSRVLLIAPDGSVVRLTKDHKPTEEAEVSRRGPTCVGSGVDGGGGV
jgi:serine/threonine protein phosphatase PrpC